MATITKNDIRKLLRDEEGKDAGGMTPMVFIRFCTWYMDSKDNVDAVLIDMLKSKEIIAWPYDDGSKRTAKVKEAALRWKWDDGRGADIICLR